MPGTLRARTITAALIAAAAFAAGYATAGTALAPPPGSSAARYAAAATAYQDKVLTRALADIPGGTRVSADKVEWANGITLIVYTSANAPAAVTALANDHCGMPAPTSCFFGETNYQDTGTFACELDGSGAAGTWFNWGSYAAVCNFAGTWSWENDSPYRIWKEQYHTGGTPFGENDTSVKGGVGSGITDCLNPFSETSDMKDATLRTLGWIQYTNTQAVCS